MTYEKYLLVKSPLLIVVIKLGEKENCLECSNARYLAEILKTTLTALSNQLSLLSPLRCLNQKNLEDSKKILFVNFNTFVFPPAIERKHQQLLQESHIPGARKVDEVTSDIISIDYLGLDDTMSLWNRPFPRFNKGI